MRSPSAAERRSPVSANPVDNLSIQSRPSGFSITSTMAGSSRKAAIAGPSAVRSIRAPRETVSDWKEWTATFDPDSSRPHIALGDGDD